MRIGGGQNRLKPHSHFTHSHKLPKIAISLALLLSGANVALAEESDAFIGLGIGYGGDNFKTKYSYMGNGNMIDEQISKIFGGVDYGFVVGFKQFFTPYLGLRYYDSINLNHSKIGSSQINLIENHTNVTLINYSVNVDFLGNFISNETIDFGGFVGVGIGGNSWIGQAIDNLENNSKKLVADYKAKYRMTDSNNTSTSLDVAINAGLRANIAKYHGVELVARVPILKTYLFKIDGMGGGQMEDYTISTIHTYSILARYTFSF